MTVDQFVLEVGQALDAIKLVPRPSDRRAAVERVVEMVQEWYFEREDEKAPRPRAAGRKKAT